MQKQWRIKTPNPKLQVKLSDSLCIHPILAQLLINRQITDVKEAQDFLVSDASRLHDPFLLTDMDKAVKRIKSAQKNNERVLIFGDYDVDGVTSSVLLKDTLQKIGVDAINYIPHRINEGYGLNHAIVDFAKEKGISLLIAVDCGTTAVSEIDALNEAGIDVIVVDHHEPLKEKLPAALAVINPKRKDCTYPFKDLASVGLVFKLAQGLLKKPLDDDFDLVAIGTIADVAELVGENRIFVKEGMPRIATTKNYGLLALMDSAGIKGKKMKPYFVSFILGPRINAAGRISTAEKSLELLLAQSPQQAHSLAQALEDDNRTRQKTQSEVIDEALSIVEREVNFKDHKIIVLCKEGWHQGVVGIVASRIAETYYRPTIVISLEDGIGNGSARSIERFHIYDAIAHCNKLLEDFGGHQYAAGITIRQENIDAFRNMINEFANSTIQPEDLIPTLEIDAQIPLSVLNSDLVKDVEALEPCGVGNPRPLFCSRGLTLKSEPARLGKDTIKFWVTDGTVTVEAIGFGMGKYYGLVTQSDKLDIAYSITLDDWNKEPAIMLRLKDIKISSV